MIDILKRNENKEKVYTFLVSIKYTVLQKFIKGSLKSHNYEWLLKL